MVTFSIIPPMNLFEEGKRLLAVNFFEATNSIFKIPDENNTFSISTPVPWISEGSDELINKLNEILELRPQNDIKLHVKEVQKQRRLNGNRKQWL